jgi:hypothetical protein
MAAAEDGLILLVVAPVTCTDVFDGGRLLKHGGYQPGPGTSHTDFLNFSQRDTLRINVAPSEWSFLDARLKSK